ncbi:hypothetical protein [Lacisediminimonas profundi]|uniref:hypothetical protein n=1 Tax=Lacisediminimonas profundi TaxID=2603856 RepID=UPI00124B9C7A|nr:hypothetical protein [Lacisediminimonas profundi]
MLKALVWPPVNVNDYGGIGAVKGYFSWFFGHIFSEIDVPLTIESALASDRDECPYVSAAALFNSDKVTLIPNVKIFDQLVNSYDLILFTAATIENYNLPIPVKKMRGSSAVTGSNLTNENANTQYYYVGNPRHDKNDAFNAVSFSYWHLGGADNELLNRSHERIRSLKVGIKKDANVSLFGTGPSLAEAASLDHSDAFPIVCNTIVKNRRLMAGMKPGIIVAADAHFHFSYHRYSARLLSDIYFSIKEYGYTFFTFDKFAVFLQSRVPQFSGLVFGVPAGRREPGYDFDEQFAVCPGESVINMFMLPIAMYLGDRIKLHGFTGRAPSDAYFWAHSDLHQYGDLMPDVRAAHPAFFENRDYPGYAELVEGQIEARISLARAHGKAISSATTTFYECLLTSTNR